MKVLMCRPNYYGIEYEINPWMNIKSKPNHPTALKQWETLYQTLKKCDVTVELIDHAAGWPDMTFTANAGLYFHDKIILAHFKYKERQGEMHYFKKWFEEHHFRMIGGENLPYFEGEGDALQAGNLLFAGYGFRTERQFYEVSHFFKEKKLIYCELVDPCFYHLDTCFCPLSDVLALWYPEAFSEYSQAIIQENIELILVPEAEAKRFACNAVVNGKQIVIPSGCPETTKALERHGYTVHACEMDEYIKAGGACKCLVLRIN